MTDESKSYLMEKEEALIREQLSSLKKNISLYILLGEHVYNLFRKKGKWYYKKNHVSNDPNRDDFNYGKADSSIFGFGYKVDLVK